MNARLKSALFDLETERVFEVGKILYVESDNKHLRIVLVSGEVCVTRAKINKYYDFLLERNFAQPHKSYMVNLYYVKEFNNQYVTFDNGVAIPISRSKSADFKRAFNRYLNDKKQQQQLGNKSYNCNHILIIFVVLQWKT